MSEEQKVKEEKKEANYVLVNIPTGQALAIQSPSGEVLQTEDALVEILNILKDIKKVIG